MVAFAQSHHGVALFSAAASLVSGFFVATYLGWLPFADQAVEARFLAHVAVISAVVLGLLLLRELGLLQRPEVRRSVVLRMTLLGALTILADWLVDAREALALSSLVAIAVGLAGLMIAIRSARRGDRLAWLAVSGVTSMLVALSGLSWIALDRGDVRWQVHALSAVAGMAYLTCMGAMLWLRYSYLIELREVLAQGPRYDPITRMHSHTATTHLVDLALARQHHNPTRPVVLIAISLGNLYALENLHGRAALNHALFVCASRLRRCVPAQVEMGRLSEDGFLLVARDATDLQGLVKLGRVVAEHLARPVRLSTSAGADNLEAAQANWAAQVGVGMLATGPHAKPAAVIALVRDMSRTAWSFSSRVAWHDQASGRIAELPALDPH
jgi:GGDEF domain-containing protein